MGRLVDADELKTAFPCGESVRTESVRATIDHMATVDAEPVKHGHWIRMSDADGSYYACSECGESLERKEHYDPQFDLFPRLKSIDKSRYCPHCGAYMEAEDVQESD